MAKELSRKQKIAFRVIEEALSLFSLKIQRYLLVYMKKRLLPTDQELRANVLAASRRINPAIADAMLDEFRRQSGGSVDHSRQFRASSRTIDALIADKQKLFNNHLKNAVRVMQNDAAKFDTISDQIVGKAGADLRGSGVQVGRRLDDAIRTTSTRAIERAIVEGRGRQALVNEIRDSLRSLPSVSKDGQNITIMIQPYNDPNLTRTYNLKKYSELVALTTTREAEQQANISRAGELGTTLVKYNYFAKDYKDDPVCKRINGEIFSLDPNGEIVGGYYFPYWKDKNRGVPGEYNTAHPRCRHIFKPIDPRIAVIEKERAA